ncbi:hypothetical protein MSAN_00471100 [Mycena sanguinolenta]|uniref:Uncharacterized protein n=1 Tax=Mycena sanguinolenta TaxID=230812 RepID=A0A8H6ZDR6_9AGAR|nr:hypothetical protein MSAN_00471100 [Mycena sanguinolenta]
MTHQGREGLPVCSAHPELLTAMGFIIILRVLLPPSSPSAVGSTCTCHHLHEFHHAIDAPDRFLFPRDIRAAEKTQFTLRSTVPSSLFAFLNSHRTLIYRISSQSLLTTHARAGIRVHHDKPSSFGCAALPRARLAGSVSGSRSYTQEESAPASAIGITANIIVQGDGRDETRRSWRSWQNLCKFSRRAGTRVCYGCTQCTNTLQTQQRQSGSPPPFLIASLNYGSPPMLWPSFRTSRKASAQPNSALVYAVVPHPCKM